MGSVGAPEIMVILLIGLLVLGPTRLPDAARQAGKAIAEFKRITRNVQQEFKTELKNASAPVADPPADSSTTAPPTSNGTGAGISPAGTTQEP